MAEINWKAKYTELKSKYMSAVDAAYRIGCEQGMQMAQQQQMQEQQAAAEAQAQAAAQGNGQPGQEGGAPGEEQPASEHPQGSELDQHIAQLEGMLGKGEISSEDQATLMKSIAAIKLGMEMKKSDLAVKGIVSALNKPFAINPTAQHNLKPSAAAAVTMQHEIVNDIMSAWKAEEQNTTRDIIGVVTGAGLKKD